MSRSFLLLQTVIDSPFHGDSSIFKKEGVIILYPNRLHRGDTVGVIAPAGPPKKQRLYKALPILEEIGLHVKLGQHIDKTYGYLAGTDEQRLSDLHQMIANPEIRGIIFARGGYGTPRLVQHLDYELIQANPKIIWGYSDITYLHTTIRQKTGLITFHGPMLATDMAKDQFNAQSKRMLNQLFEPTVLHYTEDYDSPLTTLARGRATGQLVGGNLSLLVSTLGTPYEIDTKDKLVLIEDIGEVPYKVDSMLNQLTLAGKLADASGVIIGDFKDAAPKDGASLTLDDVFKHYLGNFHGPVMRGFKIGHCLPHFAVPLGTEATLDTEKKQLTIMPGVQ